MTYSIIFKGEEKKDGMVKITMTFYKKDGGNRVPKVINITGPYDKWNKETGSFHSVSTDLANRNKELQALKDKYYQIAEEWTNENRDWNTKQWAHALETERKRKNAPRRINVRKVFEEIIAMMKQRKRLKDGGEEISSAATARAYTTLKNSLETFVVESFKKPLSEFYMEDIDSTFVNNYVLYVGKKAHEKGNKGGLSQKIRLLNGLMYYAEEMKIEGVDKNVLALVKPKKNATSTLKRERAIPEEYKIKIENVDRSLFSQYADFYFDIFLFSLYTGMAPIDVIFLKKSSLQKDRIVYQRIKFPKIAKPPYVEKAKKIVEKYQHQSYKDYVFPIIQEIHQTEKSKRNRIKTLEYSVNLNLKKLATIIGYKKELTWYCARATYITRAVDSKKYDIVEIAVFAGNNVETIRNNYYVDTKPKDTKAKMDDIV